MSRYKFSSAQRYAIFLTHDMKCYLCQVPVDLTSMVVDHVLPEFLLDKPSLLNAAKSNLGLADSFEVNSFENWMPACSACNGTKSSIQFEPSLIVQVLLQKLAKKAGKARKLCEEVLSDRKVANAFNVLERAQESGWKFEGTAREKLFVLLRFASLRALVRNGQPLRLTPLFQLVTTTVADATQWGATHWSLPPRAPGEPSLVVLFRAEQGECATCGLIHQVYQPINQEGGAESICGICLSDLDWMDPVILGDLPTHVAE